MARLISGGFYVTRVLQKPEGLGELLPERLLTLSSCLTEFLPDAWAFEWASYGDAELAAAFEGLGLSAELLPLIRESVGAAFAAGELGWSNVWQSAEAAQALLTKLGVAGCDLMVVELAIPEDFVPALLTELVPAPGDNESGLYAKLKAASPVHPSAAPLGWELLGAEIGGGCHSWLCNAIQDDAALTLGIRPGALGLLPSEEDARAVYRLIASGVGAEPVPWFPGRLSQITGMAAESPRFSARSDLAR